MTSWRRRPTYPKIKWRVYHIETKTWFDFGIGSSNIWGATIDQNFYRKSTCLSICVCKPRDRYEWMRKGCYCLSALVVPAVSHTYVYLLEQCIQYCRQTRTHTWCTLVLLLRVHTKYVTNITGMYKYIILCISTVCRLKVGTYLILITCDTNSTT